MGGNASLFLKDIDVSKGIDLATTEKIWAVYDKDNNGVLDRSEAMYFIADWCQAHGVQDVPGASRIFWAMFDTNNDGTVSKQELLGSKLSFHQQFSESRLLEAPTPLGRDSAEGKTEDYRTRVSQILEACDPGRLSAVDELLRNFNGRYSALLTFLETSYGNHENFPRTTMGRSASPSYDAKDDSEGPDRVNEKDEEALDMELEFDFNEYLKAKKFTPAEMEKMKQLSNVEKRNLLSRSEAEGGDAVVPGSLIETTVFMTQISVLGKDRLVQRFVAVTKDKLRIFSSSEELALRKPLFDLQLCPQTTAIVDDEHVMSHTMQVISRVGGDTKPHYIHFSSDAERDKWVSEINGALSRLPPEHKDSIVLGHHAFELTFDMMLGIRTSVGRMEALPMESILKEESMLEAKKTLFPQKGSKETPPHKMQDFWFTDFAPNLFRKLRARYAIDPASYLIDICGNFQYLEFISNSKSGEFFFYSHNKKYMIKTVSKQECRTMMEMLPGYYKHVMNQPNTLLCKYFGLYQVKSTRTIHFLIMGNVFPPGLEMTRLYDLKGSTKGRAASEKDRAKSDCVYKDLDLISEKRQFVMRGDIAGKLIEQIRVDVGFLREHNIIDYSMLVGVRERVKREARVIPPPPASTPPLTPTANTPTAATAATPTATANTVATFSATTGTSDSSSVATSATSATVVKSTESPTSSNSSASSLLPEIWKTNFDSLADDLSELRKLSMEELSVLSEQDFLQRANNNLLAISIFQKLPSSSSSNSSVSGRDSSNNSNNDPASARSRRHSVRPVDFQFKATFPTPPTPSVPPPSPVGKSPGSLFNTYQGGIQGIKGEVYHMGLIDTLIQYGVAKKMESTLKSSVLGSDQKMSISVVNPVDYATRFEGFLNQTIVPGFS